MSENEQKIADAKLVTELVKTPAWDAVKRELLDRREMCERLIVALPVETPHDQILRLRMRRHILQEMLALPDEIIGAGVVAHEERQREEKAKEDEAVEKARFDVSEKSFGSTIRKLLMRT